MAFSLSSIYTFVSGVPYRIHPSLHFKIYKLLVNVGLKGIFHDCVVKFMVKHIKRGDCVMDIGANQGTYAYSLLKAVGKQGVVYSFEPNPVIAMQLRKNMKQSNVIIENLAVSNTTEDKVFYRHTKGCGPTSSLEFFDVLDRDRELEEINVKCVTLDSYCRSHNLSPDLIKIDVEGHEFNVIKGAEWTIRSHRPYIVFEFIEELWEKKRIKEIFELLSPGYHLIRIEDKSNAMEVYMDYKPHCYPDFRKSRVVNIGCIPRSEPDVVIGKI
ncbi:MAG: FkbM family methyltransferase [Desulfobacterales bacterium]|nr:FkbM family methyltransferase [Desulfobacterales bacterium]